MKPKIALVIIIVLLLCFATTAFAAPLCSVKTHPGVTGGVTMSGNCWGSSGAKSLADDHKFVSNSSKTCDFVTISYQTYWKCPKDKGHEGLLQGKHTQRENSHDSGCGKRNRDDLCAFS